MLLECAAGFLTGALARYFVPDSAGFGADTLLGIVGGGTGAFVYKLFGHRVPFDGFDAWSVLVAVASAIGLIIVSRSVAGRRTIAP